MCLVFAATAAVMIYRLIMTINYCDSSTPVACFILTNIISAVLNAASIVILGKVSYTLTPITHGSTIFVATTSRYHTGDNQLY